MLCFRHFIFRRCRRLPSVFADSRQLMLFRHWLFSIDYFRHCHYYFAIISWLLIISFSFSYAIAFTADAFAITISMIFSFSRHYWCRYRWFLFWCHFQRLLIITPFHFHYAITPLADAILRRFHYCHFDYDITPHCHWFQISSAFHIHLLIFSLHFHFSITIASYSLFSLRYISFSMITPHYAILIFIRRFTWATSSITIRFRSPLRASFSPLHAFRW
jgi:hypothetical protein